MGGVDWKLQVSNKENYDTNLYNPLLSRLRSFFSGTYLGSNPNFHRTPNNNKKRPISPEQVLRLFGNNQSNPKLNVERPRRSPASSPPSTTHQSNYRIPYGPSLHELSTRTITMVREPADGTHGFGICVKGGKEAGPYICLGIFFHSVPSFSLSIKATSSNDLGEIAFLYNWSLWFDQLSASIYLYSSTNFLIFH